jgi:hypothetical protein
MHWMKFNIESDMDRSAPKSSSYINYILLYVIDYFSGNEQAKFYFGNNVSLQIDTFWKNLTGEGLAVLTDISQ